MTETQQSYEDDQQKTTVVNLHRAEYDVYIGRAGKGKDGYFGNPFDTKNFSRDEAIEQYAEMFNSRIKTDPLFRDKVLALRGKVLGCFCKPQRCHGDIIAGFVNETFEKMAQDSVTAHRDKASFDVELREMACIVAEAKLPDNMKVPEVHIYEGTVLGGEKYKAWFNDHKAFIMTKVAAQRTLPVETIETPMRTEMERDHQLYDQKRQNILASMEG